MAEPRFFCIRGFMKSGTNWLGSLLSSHADISVVGEFHWENLVTALHQNLVNEAIYHDPDYKEYVRHHLDRYLRDCIRYLADDSALVIGERTPHTIQPIVLRGCPVISIIRDGRDVLVSRAFHLFNEPGVHRLFQRIPAMAKDLERFQADPWFFKKNPEVLLRHEVMVRESVIWWRDHLQSDYQAVEKYPNVPIRFVRYEDLHRDTQGERERLFEFLDVDPDRAAKISGHLKPGFKQERPTEFLRKGIVGDWKNYFTDDTKKWFKDEAGEELMRQGYTDSLHW